MLVLFVRLALPARAQAQQRSAAPSYDDAVLAAVAAQDVTDEAARRRVSGAASEEDRWALAEAFNRGGIHLPASTAAPAAAMRPASKAEHAARRRQAEAQAARLAEEVARTARQLQQEVARSVRVPEAAQSEQQQALLATNRTATEPERERTGSVQASARTSVEEGEADEAGEEGEDEESGTTIRHPPGGWIRRRGPDPASLVESAGC